MGEEAQTIREGPRPLPNPIAGYGPGWVAGLNHVFKNYSLDKGWEKYYTVGRQYCDKVKKAQTLI